jgi:hypothetical protein
MTSINKTPELAFHMLLEGLIEAILVAAAAITFAYPSLNPEKVRSGNEVRPGGDLQKALNRVGMPLRLSDRRAFFVGLTLSLVAIIFAIVIALGQ